MAGSRSLGSLVLDLIARVGGFEQGMDKAARVAADRAKRISKNLAAIGTAAVAVAGAVTAAAVSWTKDVVNLGVELDKFAKISKSSTQEFQRWAVGAQSVGISQEKLSDQLKDFNEKLGEFRETGGGGMKDFFEQIAPKIGITAEAFKNLSGPQALQLYYDSLEKANLSQEQLSFYLESMASDTTALIPLLRNGGEGFRKWGDEADRLGSILDDKTMEAIRGVREQSARLDQIMMGLKVTVAEELLPPFERFARLLGEDETQDGLRTLADLLGKTAGAAVTFAEKIAQAGGAYREFLANQGFLPADQLGDEKQIRERIRKLSKMAHGDDPLNQIRRGIFGGAINEQLREAIAELNGFQFRNVVGGSDTFDPNAKTSGSRTGGGGKGGSKARELPDFMKDAREEMQRMMEVEARAREQFDAMAATLAGPLADANYRYQQDLKELNELARVGSIGTDELATAQENLRKQHEANVKAIQDQLTPAEQYIESLKEENEFLSSNRDQQMWMTAARYAGADATRAQVEEAYELLKVNEQLAESMSNWEDLNRNIAGSLYDIVSGSKSAKDGIKDFFDSLNSQILQNITEDWADSITDFLKGFGKKGSGTTAFGANSFSSGGGNWWTNLLSAFGFGGGKAGGGWAAANTIYEVNEQGLEMATVRGRDYLLTGGSGASITPAHKVGVGGLQQTNNFTIQGRIDRRTQDQIAAEVGRRATTATRRNGW